MISKLIRSNHQTQSENDVASDLRECKAKLDAISQSQAVIEFQPSGTIITANKNFLGATGYELSEIVGNHHRIFMHPDDRESEDYRRFWEELRAGEFHCGQFKRVRRDGAELWLHAMYYPIHDEHGRVTKVVKFASDITEEVQLRSQADETGEIVAESIQQMVQTISEISQHVNQAAGLAFNTEQQVDCTSDAVQKLDASTRVIENLVDLIRSLSEQTNLLALNATIESARAGEAGKGFAVVANEVKELAKQTATATESIDTSVADIRSLVAESVESSGQVSTSIRSVTESMQSVAAAVEQQSATMQALSETTEKLKIQ